MDLLINIFTSILNMSITASYAAVAVIFARLLLKKAPKVYSYALWAVVLFRLICPFSFSSAFSLLGLLQPSRNNTTAAQYIQQSIGITAMPGVNGGGIDLEPGTTANSQLPAAFTPEPINSADPIQIITAIAAIIWLVVIVIMLVYSVFSYLRLKNKISTATLVSGETSGNIYESEFIQSPFVCGLLKPRIYLPPGLAGNEREYILRHEKIHIRRLDHILKAVAYAVLALHWFNPLIWLSYSLMAKDMEMSCDEAVLKNMNKIGSSEADSTSYGSSLLALATRKRIPVPGPLAFGDGNVKARIRNILNYKKPAFRVMLVSFLAVAILIFILASNPVNSYSIYNHPEGLLAKESLSLKPPARILITDNVNGKEYNLTDADTIARVTEIIENIKIDAKEINKSRSEEPHSRYSVSYYNDIDDPDEDYRVTVHIDPVIVDNSVKPSFRYRLVNQKEILARFDELLASISAKFDYNVDYLWENRTQYVGNHVKVGSLLNGMPLPEGITRSTLELQTKEQPYGITYHYNLVDDSAKVSEEQFLKNSVLIFALVDNVDIVTHLGHWSNKLLSSTPFQYSYTRDVANKIVGGDVRQFAESRERLAELVEILKLLGTGNTDGSGSSNTTSSDGDQKTAFKGLELYVWRNPEITGDDKIYYTLLPGTNRNKTAEEVYDISVATTDIEAINRELAVYKEVELFVRHPRSIGKEEMNKIVDQLKIANGSIAVGTSWFDTIQIK